MILLSPQGCRTSPSLSLHLQSSLISFVVCRFWIIFTYAGFLSIFAWYACVLYTLRVPLPAFILITRAPNFADSNHFFLLITATLRVAITLLRLLSSYCDLESQNFYVTFRLCCVWQSQRSQTEAVTFLANHDDSRALYAIPGKQPYRSDAQVWARDFERGSKQNVAYWTRQVVSTFQFMLGKIPLPSSFRTIACCCCWCLIIDLCLVPVWLLSVLVTPFRSGLCEPWRHPAL